MRLKISVEGFSEKISFTYSGNRTTYAHGGGVCFVATFTKVAFLKYSNA